MPIANRSLTLAANTTCLHAAMEFVRTGALEANLPEASIGQLELVIEEIFVNVCRYGYVDGGPGLVTFAYTVPAPGELSVEIADQGKAFNPLAEPAPELAVHLEDRPIGGLGIFLVKKLAPFLTYRRDGDWNRLTFRISASC